MVNPIFATAMQYRDSIVNRIIDFENNLDDSQEVRVIINSMLIDVAHIGCYEESQLLLFIGIHDEAYIQIIQHVNQINISLVAIRKADANKSAKRIGFDLK